jgi:hypothetical protein
VRVAPAVFFLFLLNVAAASPVQPARYDRDAWPHWSRNAVDCMNTRHAVLHEESVIAPTMSGCNVETGSWVDPFSGERLSDPRTIDIDHLVPLAEAHRSGGHAWDRPRRQAYANDRTNPDHLVAVHRSLNRSKGDKDPADWMPPANRCWYLRAWIGVKARWELEMDDVEAAAVGRGLLNCALVSTQARTPQ